MGMTGRQLTPSDFHALDWDEQEAVEVWLIRHKIALRDCCLVEQDELAGCVHIHTLCRNEQGRPYAGPDNKVATNETVIGGQNEIADPFPHWSRRR